MGPLWNEIGMGFVSTTYFGIIFTGEVSFTFTGVDFTGDDDSDGIALFFETSMISSVSLGG